MLQVFFTKKISVLLPCNFVSVIIYVKKKKLEQNIGKEEKIKDRQKNENMGKKNKKVFYV